MKKLLFLFLLISSFAFSQSQLCDYVRITNVSQLPDSTVMAVCNGTLHQPGNTRTQAMPFSMLVQKLRQLGIVAFADTLSKIASQHYVDSAVSAAGSGTVTSVSVTTNQGVSGTVSTATTTPAITLSLGALTGVTSLNGLVVTPNTGVITTGTWNGTSIDTAKTNAVSNVVGTSPIVVATSGKTKFVSCPTCGTGTVTSVGTGLGLSGGTINTTGTIIADTTYLATKSVQQTITNKLLSSGVVFKGTSIDTTYANAVSAIGCNPPLLCAVAGKKVFLTLDTTRVTGAPTYYYIDSLAGTISGGSGWSLIGNSGTNPATNFIGTTDTSSLVLKTNNIQAGYLSDGNSTGTYLTFYGANAGVGNSGAAATGVGFNAANGNTGSNIVALGQGAAFSNTGSSVIAMGQGAAAFNTGSHVLALGGATAPSNTFNYVIALGEDVAPTANNQFYLSDSSLTAHMNLNGGAAFSVLENDGAGNASWTSTVDTVTTNAVSDVVGISPVSVATSGKTKFVSCPTCVTSAVDSTRLIRTDTIHVTSAEILALNSSPKVLVGAPGVNKFVTVIAVYYFYNYGTTPYALANTIVVQEGDFTTNVFADGTGAIGGSVPIYGIMGGGAALFAPNTPVVLAADGGSDPTGGDGTLIISITYQINHF